ncbi:putative zinc-binding metallopeptidase, partial [Pseudomonadales bacterium]|nr:putative zinc-binding metallopeptidase [Pseudomonadales bacterium]
TSFDELLEKWLPLTYALNSINRSSGQSDLYPFVLSRPVIEKLHYVHDVIRNARFS